MRTRVVFHLNAKATQMAMGGMCFFEEGVVSPNPLLVLAATALRTIFPVLVEYYGLDAAGAEMEGQPRTKAPSIKLERRHREQVSTPTDLLV